MSNHTNIGATVSSFNVAPAVPDSRYLVRFGGIATESAESYSNSEPNGFGARIRTPMSNITLFLETRSEGRIPEGGYCFHPSEWKLESE